MTFNKLIVESTELRRINILQIIKCSTFSAAGLEVNRSKFLKAK